MPRDRTGGGSLVQNERRALVGRNKRSALRQSRFPELSPRHSGARAKPASPESITTACDYGFRPSPLSRLGRNDERTGWYDTARAKDLIRSLHLRPSGRAAAASHVRVSLSTSGDRVSRTRA